MRRPGAQIPRPPESLEAATAALIEDVGGFVAAARLAQRGISTLARYTDPSRPDTMPAGVVAVLERVATYPHVTAWLARWSRHVLLPLPGGTDHAGVAADLGRIAERVAPVFADGGAALADGKVDRAEARRLRADLAALMHAAADMYQHLAQIAEGGEG